MFFFPFPHSFSFLCAVLKQLITFQLRALPLPFYGFLFFRSFPTVLAVNPETCCSKTNTGKPGRGGRLEDSGVAVDWEMRGWWQAADREFCLHLHKKSVSFFLSKAGFSLFHASRENVVHFASSHLSDGNWPESRCPFHLQIYTCGTLQKFTYDKKHV